MAEATDGSTESDPSRVVLLVEAFGGGHVSILVVFNSRIQPRATM
jgi:hypothetical protein